MMRKIIQKTKMKNIEESPLFQENEQLFTLDPLVFGLEERTREGGAMWLRDRITVTALDRKLGKMKMFDFLAN